MYLVQCDRILTIAILPEKQMCPLECTITRRLSTPDKHTSCISTRLRTHTSYTYLSSSFPSLAYTYTLYIFLSLYSTHSITHTPSPTHPHSHTHTLTHTHTFTHTHQGALYYLDGDNQQHQPKWQEAAVLKIAKTLLLCNHGIWYYKFV